MKKSSLRAVHTQGCYITCIDTHAVLTICRTQPHQAPQISIPTLQHMLYAYSEQSIQELVLLDAKGGGFCLEVSPLMDSIQSLGVTAAGALMPAVHKCTV